MKAKNSFGEKLSKTSIIRTFRNTTVSYKLFAVSSISEISDVVFMDMSGLSNSNPAFLLLALDSSASVVTELIFGELCLA